MELNKENLVELMRFRPQLKDLSTLFGVSEDTLSRRIKEWEACSFTEFKERHSFSIKQSLINKAIEQALSGNTTMLIFCLKNYCNWMDKPSEVVSEQKTIITLNYERKKKPS